LNIAGYVRVSISNGNGDSLDAQADAIREWASQHGLDLVAVHEDDGKSGALDENDRPGLAAALAALSGGADALVFHRLDPLAREQHVQEAALAKAWAQGARVFSVVYGEVLQDDPDDPMRKAMRQMMGVFGELERGIIGRGCRAGAAAKRAQGRYVGGSRPYGFALVDDDEGVRLDPIPEELAVIRRIADLRKISSPYVAIAAVLNEEGSLPHRAASGTR